MESLSAAASEAISSAPCVVLSLEASGDWQSDAAAVGKFEERCAAAASAFGRVLDVRLDRGVSTGRVRPVRFYFDSDAACVRCGRLFACNGVRLAGRASYENFDAPVEVEFCDLPEHAAGDRAAFALAEAVGVECGEYGRVLDAACVGPGRVVVSFATFHGAAAAAVALDGAAFEGRRCAASFGDGAGPSEPCCVLRGVVEAGLDDLSVVEIVGDVEDACGGCGGLKRVAVDGDVVRCVFDENRGAALCAATMDGTLFDGRTVAAHAECRGSRTACEAAFCDAVVRALEPRPAPEDAKAAEPAKELSEGEKLERAVAALRGAIAKDPNVAQTRANLAGALLRVGGVGTWAGNKVCTMTSTCSSSKRFDPRVWASGLNFDERRRHVQKRAKSTSM